MKRIRTLVIASAATLAVVSMAPAPAGAADGDGSTGALTATITAGSIGSRSVTSVSPIAMTSALSSSTLSGNYAAVVTEAARTGTNPWSVTGSLDDLTKAGGGTISNSALAISDRAVTQVASGGTSAAATGSAPLSSAVTLFSNTGQSTTAVYTGTHAAAGTVTLTPPNGSTAGVYTGTFTVTLVQ